MANDSVPDTHAPHVSLCNDQPSVLVFGPFCGHCRSGVAHEPAAATIIEHGVIQGSVMSVDWLTIRAAGWKIKHLGSEGRYSTTS
jgi:hypothetical protein